MRYRHSLSVKILYRVICLLGMASRLLGQVVVVGETNPSGPESGFEKGDLLVAWESGFNDPAGDGGVFKDTWDWLWFVHEYNRGQSWTFYILRLEREHSLIHDIARRTPRIRPLFSESDQDQFQLGKDLIAEGRINEGVAHWRAISAHRAWLDFEEAQVLDKAGRWQDEETAYQRALERAPNAKARSFILLRYAIRLIQRQDVRSQTLIDELVRLCDREWPNSLHLAKAQSLQGNGALQQGNLTVAQALLQSAAEIQLKLAPRSLDYAGSMDLLGSVAWERNDLETAEGLFKESLAIREEIMPGSAFVAASQLSCCALELDLGDVERAQSYCQQALALFEALDPESVHVADTLVNSAAVESTMGNLFAAKRYLQKAAQIYEKQSPGRVPNAYASLGGVLADMGETSSAEFYFQKAVDALDLRVVANPQLINVVFNGLGDLALRRGDHRMAGNYFRQSRDLLIDQAPWLLGGTWRYLGALAWAQGRKDQASEHFEMALSLVDERGYDAPLRGQILSDLGELAFDSGDWSESVSYFQQALQVFSEYAPESFEQANVWCFLGRLALHRQDWLTAQVHFESSAALLNARIDVVNSQDKRSHFYETLEDTFEGQASALMYMGLLDESFEVLEGQRARGLLKHLLNRPLQADTDPYTEQHQKLSSLYDYYQDAIWRLKRDIRQAVDRRKQEALKRQLSRLEHFWRGVKVDLGELKLMRSRDVPGFVEWRHPRAVEVAECRGLLDSKSALLAFCLLDESGWALLLTRDGPIKVFPISQGEQGLATDIDSFLTTIRLAGHGSMGTKHLEILQRQSNRLYRKLLHPVESDLLGIERLVIVPDGPLWRLPFDALGRGTQDGFEYLIDEMSVSLTASATLLAQQFSQQQKKESLSIALFGGANYSSEKGLSIPGSRTELSPLPGSAEEVKQIAALYPQAEVYLGDLASERQFMSLGKGVDVIHVAAHGQFVTDSPMDSWLAFSGSDESIDPDKGNGLVQAWEIMSGLQLSARLVVLSACQSAVGEDIGGEGVLGLTRAFHYAGGRSVLASLWNVADASTVTLMREFHIRIRSGAPIDKALQDAKRTLRDAQPHSDRSEPTSHPYYWASFQVYGPWDPIR